MLRAVLLDAVGTLLHLREPVGASYARLARQHGVVVPAERLDDAFRRVLRSAPPMVFPGEPPARVPGLERAWWQDRVRETFRAADQSVRFRDFEAFFAAIFAHFARAGAWVPAANAREALETLRAHGRRLAVASNFDGRLHGILRGHGLSGCLDLVWLPGEAGCAKPDPRFLLGACRRLRVEPTEAVLVGDEPEQDLAAGRAAGLATLDVRSLATLLELPARIRALEEETAT